MVRANGYEPNHGNLIPEYERVVAEAEPLWFLMEESPFAPIPRVLGYSTSDFILDNSKLDSGDGLGFSQRRKRRFTFGLRGDSAPDLRRWITYAALELPDHAPSVVSGDRGLVAEVGRRDAKEQTATCSGKTKARAVVAREASGGISEEKAAWQCEHGKSGLAPGNLKARSWEECCVLQGLPEDWLMERAKDGTLRSPLFTKRGCFVVLGNGVPLPMGRAIAQAVQRALSAPTR